MSDLKFDLPHHSPIQPTWLELDDEIKFRCHRGVSCWNECCARADVTLAPYDIIRLKEQLDIDSTEFLAKYSAPFEIDDHGIPGIKLRTDDSGACLFMTEKGCSVYENRPTACRYYPSDLLSMRALGKPNDEQHFLLMKKEHCKGHEEDNIATISNYRKEQGVETYKIELEEHIRKHEEARKAAIDSGTNNAEV